RVRSAWNEIVRVTIKPALDHVRHARHPLLFVRVVVGEEFVLVVDGDVENVAHASAIDFQLSAVGPKPQNATAMQIDASAVAAYGAVNAFVAARHVKTPAQRGRELGGATIPPIQALRLRMLAFPPTIALSADALGVGT